MNRLTICGLFKLWCERDFKKVLSAGAVVISSILPICPSQSLEFPCSTRFIHLPSFFRGVYCYLKVTIFIKMSLTFAIVLITFCHFLHNHAGSLHSYLCCSEFLLSELGQFPGFTNQHWDYALAYVCFL